MCALGRRCKGARCDVEGHSHGGERGEGLVSAPPPAAAPRPLLPAPSLSRQRGPHVLQELLAVGGGAMLVDDSLRLPQQGVREQGAACFEHPCKTASARNEHSTQTRSQQSKRTGLASGQTHGEPRSTRSLCSRFVCDEGAKSTRQGKMAWPRTGLGKLGRRGQNTGMGPSCIVRTNYKRTGLRRET